MTTTAQVAQVAQVVPWLPPSLIRQRRRMGMLTEQRADTLVFAWLDSWVRALREIRALPETPGRLERFGLADELVRVQVSV